MIEHFDTIVNLGLFKDWRSDTPTQFARLTLIFAENAKGKTTLTNILRSLSLNDPDILLGRRRIGSDSPPFVKISTSGGSLPYVFTQTNWTHPLKTIHIFDEFFIDTTVYSGMVVTPSQRSVMHDLINGARGATLQLRAQSLRENRQQYRDTITELENQIRNYVTEGMDLTTFLELEIIDDLAAEISIVDNAISAYQNRQVITQSESFTNLSLPTIALGNFQDILGTNLISVQNNAMNQVRNHITSLSVGQKRG